MPLGTSEKIFFSITCIFSFTYTESIILSVLKVSGLKTLHFFLLLFLLFPDPEFLSGKHLICPSRRLSSPNPFHLTSQLSALKRTEMWQRGAKCRLYSNVIKNQIFFHAYILRNSQKAEEKGCRTTISTVSIINVFHRNQRSLNKNNKFFFDVEATICVYLFA